MIDVDITLALNRFLARRKKRKKIQRISQEVEYFVGLVCTKYLTE